MHAVMKVAPNLSARAQGLSLLEESAAAERNAVLGMQEASSTNYLHQHSGGALPGVHIVVYSDTGLADMLYLIGEC